MEREVPILSEVAKTRTGEVTIPLSVLNETERPMSAVLYAYLKFYAEPKYGILIASRNDLRKLLKRKTARPVDDAVAELLEKGFIKRVEVFVLLDPKTGEIPERHEYTEVPGKMRRSLGHAYEIFTP